MGTKIEHSGGKAMVKRIGALIEAEIAGLDLRLRSGARMPDGCSSLSVDGDFGPLDSGVDGPALGCFASKQDKNRGLS